MSVYNTYRRFFLEIEKIGNGQYPSFKELTNYLIELGEEVGDRTLQRDIHKIREYFAVVIEYDRARNGYFINYEKSQDPKAFCRFLEIVSTAEMLSESLKENSEILSHISFDMGGQLKGIENLKTLLSAVRDKRIISFDHFNFDSQQTTPYTIHPYLMKEYQNRWYVIGIKEGGTQFRTFGLDRIENLKIQTITFKPTTKEDPAEKFSNTIGLVYSQHELQKVVLSFTAKQGEYIKTLPWHDTQKTIEDNNQEYRISLHIQPNYELTQKILMHGDTVKVLEPQWLVEEIKEHLKKSLNQYQ